MLRELESLKYEYAPAVASRKTEIVEKLARRRLGSAQQVLRLHEILCYLRAFPADRAGLAAAERILHGFPGRADLRRFRGQLADTGIPGTDLRFQFYWLMAIWLARRWPGQLSINWSEFKHREKLIRLLHLLLPFSESLVVDSLDLEAREWLETLKGPEETDADFVIRRFEALRVEVPVREELYEELDIPMTLSAGPGTPARGRERWPRSPVVFRDRPPSRERPDLRRRIPEVSFQVRPAQPREARELIDLANSCMVPRHRDLLIFLYADRRDVRLIDFGDGLQFACMGATPGRRLMLEAVYGFLTLMNGVPIGYVLCSALFGSSEVAYNVFETFRGAGAAEVYLRILGMIRRLFGADSFAVDPYQLGHQNEEGLESGAWWFYQKLGFRPHDPAILRLERAELRRLKANPRYRTSKKRLNEMASKYMFLQLGKSRRDVLGHISLENIGLHISHYLAERFGGERERGIATCAEEVADLLGLRSWDRLAPGERIAWNRWAPLVQVIPGARRWSAANRKALREIILAKGGTRESEFVRRFDRHRPLRNALLRLSGSEP